MLSVDSDGYIRMRPDALHDVALIHLHSRIHAERRSIGSSAIYSEIHGSTEWASTSIPAICIGWNWRVDTTARPITAVLNAEPTSNIMLTDSACNDLGTETTRRHLSEFVRTIEWQSITLNAVGFTLETAPSVSLA